jgi:hypothetical protein
VLQGNGRKWKVRIDNALLCNFSLSLSWKNLKPLQAKVTAGLDIFTVFLLLPGQPRQTHFSPVETETTLRSSQNCIHEIFIQVVMI